MSAAFLVAIVVLALFFLKALVWELGKPRRRARWDRLLEEAKATDYREEWKP